MARFGRRFPMPKAVKPVPIARLYTPPGGGFTGISRARIVNAGGVGSISRAGAANAGQ